MKGLPIPVEKDGQAETTVMTALFPQLGFFNGSQKCSDTPKDSAWWSLYYALRATATGNYALQKPPPPLRLLQHHLLPCFEEEKTMQEEKEIRAVTPVIAAAMPVVSDERKMHFDQAQAASQPFYTIKNIETLLQANGIPFEPHSQLPKDETGTFELYAYSHRSLKKNSFLRDQILYWQAKKGHLGNRRVMYLWKMPGFKNTLSVMLACNQPNTHLAMIAWERQGTMLLENLLKDNAFLDQVPGWYQQTKIVVLGSARERSLVTSLENMARHAFQKQIPLDFIDFLESPWASVGFSENLLHLLFRARVENIDIPSVLKAHLQQCVQAVLNKLDACETDQFQLYQSLLAKLHILWKQACLIQARKENLDFNKHSLSQIEQLDYQMKLHFYQKPLPETKALLTCVSLNTLLLLLEKPDMNGWLGILAAEQGSQHQQLLVFEQDLQTRQEAAHRRQSWCDWSMNKTKAWARFGYEHTFLLLGHEILKIIGASVESEPLTEKAGLTAHRGIYFCTRSLIAAQKSQDAVQAYLGNTPVSRSLGLLGLGLGAGLQYQLGAWALLEMLSVAFLSGTLISVQQKRQLRDAVANIHPEVLSPANIYRLVYALWQIAETLQTGETVRLAGTFGGIFGGTLLPLLTKFYKSQENLASEAKSKETLVSLFSVLAGNVLGNLGGQYVYHRFADLNRRLTNQEVALQYFQHLNAETDTPITVETPSAFTLFFSPRNPVTFSRQQNNLRQEVQCNIDSLPMLTLEGIQGISCEGEMRVPQLAPAP